MYSRHIDAAAGHDEHTQARRPTRELFRCRQSQVRSAAPAATIHARPSLSARSADGVVGAPLKAVKILSIHALVGTPKPVFLRATISLGSGKDGARASAALPSPGLRTASAGANPFRIPRQPTAREFRPNAPCRPNRRRAATDCAGTAKFERADPTDVGARIWVDAAPRRRIGSRRRKPSRAKSGSIMDSSSCGRNRPRRNR